MTITPSKMVPNVVHLKRWSQPKLIPQAIGQQVSAGLFAGVACYRRKLVFRKTGQVITIPDSGDLTTYTEGTWFCHTGLYAKQLVVILGLARPNFPNSGDDPVPSDPRVEIDTIGSITSDLTYTARIGLGAGGDVQDVPSEWTWTRVVIPVAPDEDFLVRVDAIEGARVFAITCYEQADDDLATYPLTAIDAAEDGPIFDAQRAALAAGSGGMHRKNAAHLLSWSLRYASSADARSIGSSSYDNVLDGSGGTVTADSAGFMFQTEVHNSISRTTVPVVMAVYANTTAGSGGKVRLRTASGTGIELTGIGTTLQWYTVTGSIVPTLLKHDLQFACDGTNTLRLYAVSLFEYEA